MPFDNLIEAIIKILAVDRPDILGRREPKADDSAKNNFLDCSSF